MTSRATLECRIYMAEDSMYRQCDALDRGLHRLESMLTDLAATVHRELCEGGPAPLEARAGTVARAVEAFEAAVDLGEIRDRAGRIRALKELVDDYQRDLGLDLGEPEEDPRDDDLELLVAEAARRDGDLEPVAADAVTA